MVSADGLIATGAISIGVAQMMFRISTIKQEKVGVNTYPLLYSGVVASILWTLYQYRIGANYSVVYSILGLFVQLYILHELKSNERKRENAY
jgi:nucleoside recognition membrane protein YjiH